MTYEQALEAIKEFFGDTSREASETKEGLQGLRDEIEMLIDTL